jgi:ParB family chromosome partitioning protein
MSKQALDGTRLNAFAVDPKDLIIIGLDTNDGPEHPLYDDRVKLPLDESMVLSIMVRGVLETVLVRKDGDAVQVVAGRQRVRCAREANARLKKEGGAQIRIPVMVRKGTDSEHMGVAITENEIRRDDTPSIRALKLQRYLALGRSEAEAAVAFGVSLQTIKNWGRLGDLDAKVLKAVDAGKIPASAAWNLSELPREEQRAELDKLLSDGHTTVKSATKAAKNAKARKKGEEEGHEKPGIRLVNKVLKLNQKASVLNGDFLKGVAWVLGDIGPRSVAGLSDLIREARGEKE